VLVIEASGSLKATEGSTDSMGSAVAMGSTETVARGSGSGSHGSDGSAVAMGSTETVARGSGSGSHGSDGSAVAMGSTETVARGSGSGSHGGNGSATIASVRGSSSSEPSSTDAGSNAVAVALSTVATIATVRRRAIVITVALAEAIVVGDGGAAISTVALGALALSAVATSTVARVVALVAIALGAIAGSGGTVAGSTIAGSSVAAAVRRRAVAGGGLPVTITSGQSSVRIDLRAAIVVRSVSLLFVGGGTVARRIVAGVTLAARIMDTHIFSVGGRVLPCLDRDNADSGDCKAFHLILFLT